MCQIFHFWITDALILVIYRQFYLTRLYLTPWLGVTGPRSLIHWYKRTRLHGLDRPTCSLVDWFSSFHFSQRVTDEHRTDRQTRSITLCIATMRNHNWSERGQISLHSNGNWSDVMLCHDESIVATCVFLLTTRNQQKELYDLLFCTTAVRRGLHNCIDRMRMFFSA